MIRAFSAGSSHLASRGSSVIAQTQTPAQRRPGRASTMNIICQLKCSSTRPEIGLAITCAIGMLIRNVVLARARSDLVNHLRISTIVQVSTPPSNRPSRKRLAISWFSVRTKAVENDTTLHTSSRQKITHLALHTEASRPAGICRTM